MKYWRTPLDAAQVHIPRGAVRINTRALQGLRHLHRVLPEAGARALGPFNAKGYYPPEVKAGAWCVNCHFCEVLCPDFAIHSTEIAPPRGAGGRSRDRRRTP